MQTYPYTPNKKPYVPSPLNPYTKFYTVTNNQSDSESSYYRFTSPDSSGSLTEDTDSDTNTYSMACMPDLPPEYQRYTPQQDQASLSPSFTVLGSNGKPPAQKSRRSTSTKWSKPAKGKKAASKAVANSGAAASSAPGYPEGWVPMNAQDFQQSWTGVADQQYIQDMYSRATEEVPFDWDGVKDRLLEDPPEEL